MAGHSVDDYLETIYFLAFPIGEYKPDPNSAAIASRVAEMLGVSRASAGEMLKRLEDASRSLGRSARRTFFAVVLPLARPGILAGGALVFLSAMKELPATLLLRPIGFDTLATEIWTDTSIGAYSAAAPSALLLIAVSAPVVYIISARRAWDLGAPG